jgi:hypothetical protein
MILTIANISNAIADQDLQAAVAAIGVQVNSQFQPEWGLSASVQGATFSLNGGNAPVQDGQDAIIYVGDSSQDPTTGVSGVFGYHSANYGNIPYGFVYLDICAAYGESWTCTLSHEVLELLGDPNAVMTVTGPAPNGAPGNVYYDFEVADPTQGDTYLLNNVTVSNFVGRAYFGMSGGGGWSNYLNLPLAPFGVRPGGYFQYEDSAGAHQITGDKVTKAQLAAKKRMKDGRRNARRVKRINQSIRKRLAAMGSPAPLRSVNQRPDS